MGREPVQRERERERNNRGREEGVCAGNVKYTSTALYRHLSIDS